MNTAKMRHALDRAEAARSVQARDEWFASMTPEHRAIHERPLPVICGICLAESGEQMQRTLRNLFRPRSGSDES
jgi:hypothetical protein